MADEISVTITAELSNDGLERFFDGSGLTFTQAAKGAIHICQNIGFAASEAIVTTEIGTLGWCFLKNLDDTNYVKYGPDSGGMVNFAKIQPGEIAAFRLYPGITFHAQADTAAVELDILILEN